MFAEHAPFLDDLFVAALFVTSFVVAGVAQTLWLRSRAFRRFAFPLDGGVMFRGRPFLGRNKTVAGLLGMTIATAFSFALVGSTFVAAGGARFLSLELPDAPHSWFLVGGIVGLVYMLGELPNSFLKRRMGIEPGDLPRTRWGRRVAYAVDQCDSVVAASLFCALVSPLGPAFVVSTTAAGVAFHAAFNVVLKRLGLKERAG
jgi:hypothetical protein